MDNDETHVWDDHDRFGRRWKKCFHCKIARFYDSMPGWPGWYKYYDKYGNDIKNCPACPGPQITDPLPDTIVLGED